MKFRHIREFLSESLATQKEFANYSDLEIYLKNHYKDCGYISDEDFDKITCKFYAYDPRVPEDVYHLSVNGYLIGFVDSDIAQR